MKDEIYDFTVQELDTKKYDLAKYILQFSSEIQEPIPILKQDDKLVISRGNISVVAGAPKSKKSMFVSALVASFYGSEAFGFTSYIKGGNAFYLILRVMKATHLSRLKEFILCWVGLSRNTI